MGRESDICSILSCHVPTLVKVDVSTLLCIGIKGRETRFSSGGDVLKHVCRGDNSGGSRGIEHIRDSPDKGLLSLVTSEVSSDNDVFDKDGVSNSTKSAGSEHRYIKRRITASSGGNVSWGCVGEYLLSLKVFIVSPNLSSNPCNCGSRESSLGPSKCSPSELSPRSAVKSSSLALEHHSNLGFLWTLFLLDLNMNNDFYTFGF